MTRDMKWTLNHFFLCSPLKTNKKKHIFTIYYLRWFISRQRDGFLNDDLIVHKLKESTRAAPLHIPNQFTGNSNWCFYIWLCPTLWRMTWNQHVQSSTSGWVHNFLWHVGDLNKAHTHLHQIDPKALCCKLLEQLFSFQPISLTSGQIPVGYFLLQTLATLSGAISAYSSQQIWVIFDINRPCLLKPQWDVWFSCNYI